MRFWLLAAVGAASTLMQGCGDPGLIVPTTPPGATIPRKSPDEKPAEAQGEAINYANRGSATGSTAKAPDVPPMYDPAPPTEPGKTATIKTKKGAEVIYETLKPGMGEEAKSGKMVSVHYMGTLADGKVFDTSRGKGAPFETHLGTGGVIDGWEAGIPGMKIGEVRKLVIPPLAGYGAQGSPGAIPPNATLTFEVELLGVK